MPISPSPAQSEASRANGALSHGPTTPDGKARAARNATRHGLRAGPFRLLPHEDPAEFAALLQALTARHTPADPAERHWALELAAATWRLRRAGELETRVLMALDGTNEPEAPALPTLATVLRYRARIERDLRLAEAQLAALRLTRPKRPAALIAANAAQLRWLAERAEEQATAAAPESCTNEPEPAGHEPPAGRAIPEPKTEAAPLARQQRRYLARMERKRRRAG